MSDIAERLRKDTMHWYDEGLAHEAAKEIDRLREALTKIANSPEAGVRASLILIALDALTKEAGQ